MREVRDFNDQLERIAEVAVVLVVGAMLAYVPLEPGPAWFVALLLLVIRPWRSGSDCSAHRCRATSAC